jgi:hypothetical protein
MRIGFNEPAKGFDLAELLEGNEGTFIAKNHGQVHIVCAQRGHSITYLKPVGSPTVDISSYNGLPQPWEVTKLSNNDISRELKSQPEANTGTFGRREVT